jgi:hypothetical protein
MYCERYCTEFEKDNDLFEKLIVIKSYNESGQVVKNRCITGHLLLKSPDRGNLREGR